MSAPQQPSRRGNEPVENVPPQDQLDPVSGPDGDAGATGDQDIDTAGTEADTEAPTARAPRHAHAIAPPLRMRVARAPKSERRPIGAHDPASMHRREDDSEAMAHSPDFHDHASGRTSGHRSAPLARENSDGAL